MQFVWCTEIREAFVIANSNTRMFTVFLSEKKLFNITKVHKRKGFCYLKNFFEVLTGQCYLNYLQFVTFILNCSPTHTALINITFSGLGYRAVVRLKQTWEKVPARSIRLFEELQALMDPSRNMSKYRTLLSEAVHMPPVIPYIPVVKKDLTFLHLGKLALKIHTIQSAS